MFHNKNIFVHFIGIGGIGMSSIAEVLINQGIHVSGSDLQKSSITEKLKKLGAKINIGHKASNIENPYVIVYSSAVREDNPEIIEAKSKQIPIMKRAEMVADLMKLKCGIAIAGTHGKTTSTSFLVTILKECGIDPTYLIGGIVKNLDGHAGVGKGNYLVTEADESDGSFLLLNPVYSVITNIDFDHMEYYKTEENLVKAFTQFANNIPFYGCCALNAHDQRLTKIRNKMKRQFVTFAVENHDGIDADYIAKNIEITFIQSKYDLFYKNEFVQQISISVPGNHNVLNSLGAIAISHLIGINFSDIAKSISKFNGIGRRCQIIYRKKNLWVIDDYAHHPTEIINTLKTIRECEKDKTIIAIFEPHRYTRTKDCWDEFQKCFFHADSLYICPIYHANEEPIKGIDSKTLSDEINARTKINKFSKPIDDISEIEKIINEDYTKETIIISLGAGAIGKEIKDLTEKLILQDENN